MKVVSAIPILKGVSPETLSYYTSLDVSPGDIIKAPVRAKIAPMLVVGVSEAHKDKTALRKAGFSLKKVSGLVAKRMLTPEFIEAVAQTALYHAASVGAVLEDLIPQTILESSIPVDARKHRHAEKETSKEMLGIAHLSRVVQSDHEERIARYKTIVRESFAQGESVLLMTPTIIEAQELHAEISRGIEENVFFLASSLTKGKFKETWSAALVTEHPVAIIGTPIAVSHPRKDIGTFIVEHESSPYYKSSERPFIDFRIGALFIAKALRRKLVLGDSFMQISTIAKMMDHEYEYNVHPKMNQQVGAPAIVIDMRSIPERGKNLSLLSPVAIEALQSAAKEKKRVFVYATRKGYAPFTVCRDCGTVLMCDTCDAPMALYKTRNAHSGDSRASREFICNRCGRRRDAKTVCSTCGGWRLEMYGVGIERVAEEVEKASPNVPIFLFTHETASTPARIKRILVSWTESDDGILLGTAAALPYLRSYAPAISIVSSLDTLLSLPDTGLEEKVFHLVTHLRKVTRESVLIQTRNPDSAPITFAASGDGMGFYRYEEKKRKDLLYPPHAVFIKISRSGNKERVLGELEEIKKMAAPYETLVYPAFVSRVRNAYHAHALIKVPTEKWPDVRLAEMLRGLPPNYIVNVSPESIL